MSARTIRIEGDIAYVPLTKGHVAVIDAADVPQVEKFLWCAHVCRHAVYALRGYEVKGKTKLVMMHRELIGAPHGRLVDHVDGNGLNNRRANLRLASNSENTRNSKKRIDNKSGYKGVCWDELQRKWRASIRLNGRQTYLGLYASPQEAHNAYREAATREYGEFARME